MKKAISILFLPILIATLIFGQSYDVSVTNISVWIKATDSSGNPVAGLTAADFEIYEDGQKMTTTCFEETGPDTLNASTQSEPTEGENQRQSAAKKIAIYLDLYNTNTQEFLSMRPRLQEFLDQVAAKKWDVMLAALMPNGKLGIIAPFTKDVPAVRASLMKAPANSQRDTAERSRVREMTRTLEMVLQTDPRVQDSALQSAYGLANEYAAVEKSITDYSLAALGGFTDYLTKMDMGEQMIVLFVSGGINIDPGRIYYDMAYRVGELLGFTADPAKFSMSFQASRESNRDIQDSIKRSIGKMNRYNVTIYAVNTRGMYSSETTSQSPLFNVSDPTLIADYQDTLGQISEQTGGLSFENTRNFKLGFDQIITDLGQQYLICYSPPPHKKPGEYHKIKVVCKKKGIDLRYRTGYLDE